MSLEHEKLIAPQINGFFFAGRAIIALIISLIGAVFILTHSVWGIFLGVILIGAMIAHAIELQHQTLHSTAFKNRAMNRWIGYLLGIPGLVSFRHYQISHLRHHRYCGTAKDSEFFTYSNARQSVSRKQILKIAFDLHRLRKVLGDIYLSLINRQKFLTFPASQQALLSIRKEYISFAVILFSAFAIAFYFDLLFYLVFMWFLPLALVAEPIHFFIEYPEHVGCNLSSTSALENSRTIRANWFWSWFTNGNNYHVEHHLHPQVPMQNLSDLHRQIGDHILHFNTSYSEFFIQNFREVT